MKIDVTQEDIDLGEPRSNTTCPIARAVRRLRSDARCISVGNRYLHVDYISFRLPVAAQLFVESFDSNCSVSPFSFEAEQFFWVTA